MKKSLLIFVWLVALSFFAAENPKLEMHDGDRAVFIGGVFMEREQEEGYIESALTLSFPSINVSYRNLGWGGDTVESHLHPTSPARPSYVPNLFNYVEKLKPSVIFVNYGMMESFRGPAGLEAFTKNYNELLDKLSSTTKRIVMISPFHHEKPGGLFPDPASHNENLRLYVAAIAKIAKERGLVFVNLFESANEKRLITNNGVHLTSEGYKVAAEKITGALGLKPDKISEENFEKLRTAIKHKNKQWWFHYRPMNSEYVYPGGTRYQDELGGIKHPMFSEIEEFARLAEKEDQGIFEMRKRAVGGWAIIPPKPKIKEAAITNAPDPELERRTFQIAEGFDVNLFAADPLINKPVQIVFDGKGRLWIASTTLYPQIKPGEDPCDKIIILEDTNGDGRADKTTVFADGLLIPTGILPTRDGAYVSDDTKIYFFRDKDGDGKADEKEVVLSGFGTEDSHHKAHVLRWDPAGRFYFNVGVFLHNNIETANGIVSQAGHWHAGMFSYFPPTGLLDVYLANSTPPNPWGHYWNNWGFDFLIDSSGQQGSNFILPTSERTSSAVEVPGGQGKLAGGEILSGRHLPPDCKGNLIAAPFKENRVARFEFSDDGSGYSLKQVQSLIVSTNSAFRPVDERMGPDGAIYIADWFNPLIGHMQHHFRDPGRDFTHGRIWRVTAKNRALVKRPEIAGAPVKDLLELLKAPEDFTRQQARNELASHNAEDVSSSLAKWVKGLDANDTNYDHHRIEALWVYENISRVEPQLLKSLLNAKEPNARAAAIVVLRNWRAKIERPIDLLAPLVRDNSPRVRLQAVIALSYFPEKRAMELAAEVLNYPMDRYLEQALKNTAIALKNIWEPALAAGEPLFGGNTKQIDFVLEAAGTHAAPPSLLALLRLGKVSDQNFEKAIATIVNDGDKKDLASLYNLDFTPDKQAKVLALLARALRDRKMQLSIKPETRKRLEIWLQSTDEKLKAEAIRLAGTWEDESFRERFIAIANDNTDSEPVRVAAIQALGTLAKTEKRDAKGHPASFDSLYKLAVPQSERVIRDAAIASMAEFDVVNAANSVINILCREPEPEEEIANLLKLIFARKDGDAHMAMIIETSGNSLPQINPDSAKVALRAIQFSGRSGQWIDQLTKQLSAIAKIDAEAKELSREELQKMSTEVATKGDAARGEKIFRNEKLNCFQCHAIGGAGGFLGPELGAVGSGSQVDYLIESVLSPNKIIKDSFETVEVLTKDGESTMGIKVRDSAQEVVLKDATRNEIVISQSQIKEKNNKKTSLMPAGLTASLTQAEFLDLIRFLSELGKPGAYANNPNPIVRRWETAAVNAKNINARQAWSEGLSWTPVYSLVSGILPLGDIAKNVSESANIPLARCRFEITAPGKIQCKLNSTEGLSLWIDGKAMEAKPTTTIDLPRGMHTALFSIDSSKRKDGLRVEFEQAPDSAGRFQLLSGK